MIPDAVPERESLARNVVLFGRMLRRLGMRITPGQLSDLLAGLEFVDLRRRDDFKNVAKAVLVNRREHLALFEMAFNLFWRANRLNELEGIDISKLVQPPPSSERQGSPVLTFGPNSDGAATGEREYIDQTFAYSHEEMLRRTDFAKLSESELAEVKRLMARIAWRLDPRRTRRTVAARRGRMIDVRTTYRRSLRYGGDPPKLLRRKRKTKPRPIVVICDISGSMERYARLLLQFVYVVARRLHHVETFVFSTRLTRITRQLARRDVDEAIREATRVVHDWGGGTRIGEALKTFNYDWARRVLNQGAVVLIISDGWDRGDIDLLEREMDRLRRSSSRLIWLNPLLGSPGYQPLVRGIQAALPHCDEFLPIHNLVSLEQLAEKLAEQR
jgi:uncharacterized protein with von Willebrand factor type A (vWA) domain